MIGTTFDILVNASASVEMNIRKYKGHKVINNNVKAVLDILTEYATKGSMDHEKAAKVLDKLKAAEVLNKLKATKVSNKNKETKKEKAIEK